MEKFRLCACREWVSESHAACKLRGTTCEITTVGELKVSALLRFIYGNFVLNKRGAAYEAKTFRKHLVYFRLFIRIGPQIKKDAMTSPTPTYSFVRRADVTYTRKTLYSKKSANPRTGSRRLMENYCGGFFCRYLQLGISHLYC